MNISPTAHRRVIWWVQLPLTMALFAAEWFAPHASGLRMLLIGSLAVVVLWLGFNHPNPPGRLGGPKETLGL